MKTLTRITVRTGFFILFAILLMAAAVSPAAAQLQGGNVYPINGTQNPPSSFGTIADAVAYMTTNGVTGSGQVVLELSSGYPGDTAPITVPAITGVSATLGITFRPAAGYTALTTIPGTSAANSFAIAVTGSYITLDGQAGGTGGTRDWTIRCTGSGASGFGRTAFRFGQSTPTANQTDVKVRYCILEGEAANTTSAIVGLEGGSSFTDKNFVVENNLIRSTGVSSTTARGYGITIANASNAGNTGLIVRNNVINDFYARGINFTGGFPASLVYGNDFYHTAPVTQNSTTEFSAFYFSTTASQGTFFHSNFIHDIQLTNGTTAVNGIYLFNGSSSGNRVKVYDNRINIGAGIQPTTFGIWGIRDNSGSGFLFDVDYNSVYIGGSPAAGTANSACYRRELSSAINLRNNIFFNARSNSGTATGTHWGVSINATANFTSINYNDYFANGTGGVLGTTDGTTTGNKATLGAWKAAVTADAASVSQNPNYLNPTGTPPNMHVDTTIATQLESGGTAVAGIDNDFEGDIRFGSLGYGGSGSAPDIGADEFNGTLLDLTPPSIVYSLLGNTGSTTTRAFANVTITDASGVNGTLGTRPRVYYKKTTNTNAWNDNTNGTDGWKYAQANGSTAPFDFTIDCSLIFGGVASGDVIQYFVVAQDNAVTPNVGINSGTFAAPPTSVALTAAAFPIGGTINSYTIVGSIAGAFTVGAGGNYATLKAAFDDINAKVVNGNITLTILASGTTETAAAVLNAVSYDGGVYTITIKPDLASTPTITGSIAAALIKLNGADNVIIDGSNSVGGTTRDLTISNTSTSAATAAIWFASLGAGQGSTGNTVKNCNVLCGADQSTSSNETFGILTGGTSISTTSDGADNDGNTFTNNAVTKSRWGIYLRGASTNTNDNCSIAQNVIGGAAFDAARIGKGGIIVQHQNNVTISQNEVRYVGVLISDTAGGSARVGIGVGTSAWSPSSTTITNSTITRNLIHDVSDEKTFSAAGLAVSGSGTPTNNVIANNMIYSVRANGTSGDHTVGLGISDGNGDKIVYNTIRLTGDLDPGSSTTASGSATGIKIVSTTPSNLTLKDNITTVDVTSNTATLKHFAIVAPATSYAWGTGGANNNDYYPKSGNAQAVLGGIGTGGSGYTEVATLAAWKTQFTPNQDGLSVTTDPPYVSATDLHLLTNVATLLESGGTPIAGVTNDYDNDARNITTPDIGADEGNFTQVITNDIAATAFVDPTNGGSKMTGAAFNPRASFENVGTANQTAVKVRYRIKGPAPSTAIIYADSTNVDLAALAGPSTVTFTSTTLTLPGTYTMEAQSFLTGDQNAANDQITGTFIGVAPLAGTYNVGSAEAAPFNSLTSAVATLNQVGISANVTFVLVDAAYTTPAETFPITINAYPGANASYRVTIKPATTATISGSSSSSIFKLAGADYVVIDGSNNGTSSRDLTIANTSTAGSTAAIWLASQGAGAGCIFDTIKNCNVACGVDPGASTSETTDILLTGNTVSTSTGGEDNDNNTISNNAITKARWGIYARGLVGNLNDSNAFTGNLIGPAALDANRIGAGGLILVFQNLATADLNEIRNVGVVFADVAGGGDRVGIGLGTSSWTVAATALTNCSVTRNRIHDIFEEKTFSAVGIVVGGTGSPSNNVIANNMIYDVRANGTGGDQTVGIGIGEGNGDKVVYNSIRLSGDIDPGSSTAASYPACGIRFAAAPTNLTLKNNVIYDDVTSNTATLHHYAIVGPSTGYVWGTGGSDNNDFYPNPANTQAFLGGIGTSVPYTDVATLAGWRTQFTPNQDAASVSANPPFVAANDLHLLTNVATPLESGATPIAGVTNDYDGEARNVSTPDIGADEGTFTPLFTNDVATTALVDPTNGGAKTVNIAFAPQAAFQNVGTANQTGVKVRYRISGPAPATTIVYADSTTIDLAALDAPTTVTFASATLTIGGVYAMEARAFLTGDQNTPNDKLTGTFEALAALAGTYLVGSGQPAPFTTLTSAVARLNQVGVAASVVFDLVDPSYTAPAETFPITINAFAGAGPSSTFTIKPAAAGCAITGSSTSAVIVLNGADYVILDGSSNGTGSRDLTITNTSTSTASAVVWGQTSAGPSDGAANNTIKNLGITGSGNTQTLIAVGLGSSTIGVTSNGTGNNSNTIANNSITKSQYGIYTGGAGASTKNTGNVIAGNEINSVTPNNVTIGGILARFENGIQITGNKVGEINRASGTNFGISLGFQAAVNLMNVTSGDEVTNAVVTGNKVASIVSPSTTGYSAAGIAVAPAASGTNLIANNMVSGVTSPATPSDFTVGIYSLCGAGSTTEIYFNSVSMTGDRGAGASTPSLALAIAGTDPIVDIRNNLLLNSQTTASTGKSYAIGLSYATYANLTSDHNDLYVSGPQGVLGIVGGFTTGTAQATLAAWKATTGKDANSVSADPLFLATNDLHIDNSGAVTSPAANAGTPLAAVTTDFDGETGNRATTPDIGADEFVTYPLTTNVVGNGTILRSPDYATYNPGTPVQLTAAAGPGSVFANWSGDLTGNTNPSTLTMNAPKTVTAHFTAATLTISDVSVLEGNAGTTQARFVVTLSHALPDTVKVSYATADSTATVGNNDYVAASGLLTINPGVVSDTLTVLVNGDTTNEPDEYFYLKLSNPTNALLNDGTGVGTIRNDDTPVDGIEDAAGIPEATYMGLGYPNPFQERMTVRFGLHSSGSVEVRIYDVQGRLVRELVNEAVQAGHKHVVWDGRDNGGRHVATGMYFVRMRTPERTFKQTIRLIR